MDWTVVVVVVVLVPCPFTGLKSSRLTGYVTLELGLAWEETLNIALKEREKREHEEIRPNFFFSSLLLLVTRLSLSCWCKKADLPMVWGNT